MAYLEHELEAFGPGASPHGTDAYVEVLVFSGVQPYVDRDVIEKVAKQAMADMLKKLKEGSAEPKEK